MKLERCMACQRPVAITWTRCRWCKKWSGLPNGPMYRSVDRKLDAFRLFGVPLGLWILFAAVVLHYQRPAFAAVVGIFGLLLVISHGFLVWHPAGWKMAELTWAAGALGTVIAYRQSLPAAVILSSIAVAAFLAMIASRDTVLRRLSGESLSDWEVPASRIPNPGPCARCGSSAAVPRAPIWCISALFVSVRHLGRVRNVCAWHGKLTALPATVGTLLLGWWGLPWGLIWTPTTIFQNLVHGGVEVDRHTLRELRNRELLEGSGSGFAQATAFMLALIIVPMVVLYALSMHR